MSMYVSWILKEIWEIGEVGGDRWNKENDINREIMYEIFKMIKN